MRKHKAIAAVTICGAAYLLLILSLCGMGESESRAASNAAAQTMPEASTTPEQITQTITAPEPPTYYTELTHPCWEGYSIGFIHAEPETGDICPRCGEWIEPEPEEPAIMLARLIWGEAGGVPSTMERAAVVWCVLNRVDDDRWPDTITDVVLQKWQFIGYSPDFPATPENIAIANDVLLRWELEKIGIGGVGRVLPSEYVFFTGDGKNNHFRTEYTGGRYWDWTSQNPYDN